MVLQTYLLHLTLETLVLPTLLVLPTKLAKLVIIANTDKIILTLRQCLGTVIPPATVVVGSRLQLRTVHQARPMVGQVNIQAIRLQT